jgi:hypothetical protein
MAPGVDAYSFPARVVPVAAVSVPPLVLLGTGVVTSTALGFASGLVIAVAGALAGQLGRDKGKALQTGLWGSWGGSPTIQRLRYRGAADVGRVQRLHQRIEGILGESLPDPEQERADPVGADSRYEEVSMRVRALTRDTERFRLLFAENVNYGQRRNLLGLRPIGALVATITLIVSGLALWLAHGDMPHRLMQFGPGAVVSFAMLLFWSLVVSPAWVRVPAEAYADQFVAAIDALSDERSRAQLGAQ